MYVLKGMRPLWDKKKWTSALPCGLDLVENPESKVGAPTGMKSSREGHDCSRFFRGSAS